MTLLDGAVRPMELPLLPDPVEPAVEADDEVVDEGAGARLIGFASGHREGRRAGHEEGFAAGYDEGRTAARAEAAERLEQLTGAVSAALAERGADWDRTSELVASQVVSLAMEVATAVVGREISSLDDAGLVALERALRVLPETRGTDGAVLRLHPDDAEDFGGHPAVPDVRVIADPTVEPGGCRLQVGDTDVDAGIADALQRVRELLAT